MERRWHSGPLLSGIRILFLLGRGETNVPDLVVLASGTTAGKGERSVKRFERLAEARSPDGTLLRLYRHDGDYLVHANDLELMSTRRHHSEERLAEIGCLPIRARARARVLIGGLGLGFTLRAALRSLGPTALVVVAELIPEIIAWNLNPEYDLSVAALDDPRVELRQLDVRELIAAPRDGYDAILLDVDNGADSLTTTGNAELYRAAGIEKTAAALRPDGRVVYWSAGPDPRFERALRRAGLLVESVRVRAHTTSGPFHTLIVGQRAG